jgi:hypothetical protein
MRILFIPRNQLDVPEVIELNRYCLENELVLGYVDKYYTIELPFSSHHISYILLTFKLEFIVAE